MNLSSKDLGSGVKGQEIRVKAEDSFTTLAPLKILMIAPTPYFSDRGCHVRIYEEARALMALGHRVRIVTYHLGRDLEPVPVDRAARVPWYTKREAGPSWHKPYLDLLLLGTALQVGRRFRPDLIHAHLHEGVVVGLPVARLLGLPLLFDYQGSLSGESLNHGFFRQGGLLHRLFRNVESWINRQADLIVTSSSSGREELIGEWQMPEQRVVALPDGVDTAVFRHYPRLEACRRLGLDDTVPVVVYLGLLNRYQGIDLLLKAVRSLIRQGRNLRLLVMGYPDQEYRRMADELNISAFTTFTGRVDYADAPLLLAAGDLAVSPKISATEANGKLLNYMACGLPVVAFDTPVNRELLGEDGIYAALGDADDLAARMEGALGDHDELRRRGRALRERARAQFSWEQRGCELEARYRRMSAIAN